MLLVQRSESRNECKSLYQTIFRPYVTEDRASLVAENGTYNVDNYSALESLKRLITLSEDVETEEVMLSWIRRAMKSINDASDGTFIGISLLKCGLEVALRGG